MNSDWYMSPFRKGSSYRVIASFGDDGGDSFVVGERLQFHDDAYDFHTGVIRFWFKKMDTGEVKILCLWVDQKEPNFSDLKLFEEIP